MNIPINHATEVFLNELKARSDVEGVILFGSWARGEQRPDSDVDLIVVLSEGYKRSIENRKGQLFEIVYVTEEEALKFWESNRNDAASLWSTAEVLYDKDGAVNRLKIAMQKVLAEGKPALDVSRLKQLRFDTEDQINYAEKSFENGDVSTANMMLYNSVFRLIEIYYDIKQEWTPAPKQRLSLLREKDDTLYMLVQSFHAEDNVFNQRVEYARQIVIKLFGSSK